MRCAAALRCRVVTASESSQRLQTEATRTVTAAAAELSSAAALVSHCVVPLSGCASEIPSERTCTLSGDLAH